MTRSGHSDELNLISREIGRTPLLTRKDEVRLGKAKELSGVRGKEARDHFARANLRIVLRLARKYQYVAETMSYPDLVHHGFRGLIKAVDHYDWRLGFRFSTLAYRCIEREMQRAISKEKKAQNSDSQQGLTDILKTRIAFFQKHGRKPTFFELGRLLGVNLLDQKERLAFEADIGVIDGSVQSIDAKKDSVGRDGRPRTIEIRDVKALPPPDSAHRMNQRALLVNKIKVALSILAPREAEIIKLRFGIDLMEPMTQGKIAQSVHPNITRDKVWQIEKVALAKLRRNPQIMGMLCRYFAPDEEDE